MFFRWLTHDTPMLQCYCNRPFTMVDGRAFDVLRQVSEARTIAITFTTVSLEFNNIVHIRTECDQLVLVIVEKVETNIHQLSHGECWSYSSKKKSFCSIFLFFCFSGTTKPWLKKFAWKQHCFFSQMFSFPSSVHYEKEYWTYQRIPHTLHPSAPTGQPSLLALGWRLGPPRNSQSLICDVFSSMGFD